MRKGFTLIELLAVIVILAIIALIAVPIVVSIINDSKNSSGEQAVELYIDSVKKAISRKQLAKSNFNPKTCTINNDGNLLCDEEEVVIDMNGIKPNKGIIEIKNNKITYKNLLLNGIWYNKIATLISDADNDGEISIGDKYTYKVNERDTFNFYVLTDPVDGKVNLIMDRNICEDGTINYSRENEYCLYIWTSYGFNTVGPDIAMNKLYKATKDWTNVPDMLFTYNNMGYRENDSGYKNIISSQREIIITANNGTTEIINVVNNNLKARLPKYEEVGDLCGYYTNGSCPPWLVDNLKYENVENDKYSNNKDNSAIINNIRGYWLLTSSFGTKYYSSVINNIGHLQNFEPRSNSKGIRPVITVSVDDLSN